MRASPSLELTYAIHKLVHPKWFFDSAQSDRIMCLSLFKEQGNPAWRNADARTHSLFNSLLVCMYIVISGFLAYLCISLSAIEEKKYIVKCASSQDSDQPAHPRSLIRVFAWRSADRQWSVASWSETLIRLSGCADWSESSLGAPIKTFEVRFPMLLLTIVNLM